MAPSFAEIDPCVVTGERLTDPIVDTVAVNCWSSGAGSYDEPDAAEARYLRAANAGVTALLDSFPVGPRAASALLYPGRPGWEPSNADRDAINRLSSNRQQAVALAARARERQRERSLRLSRGDDGAASDGDDGPLDPVTRSLVTGSCSGLPSLFDARRSGRLSGRRGSGVESE